MKLTTENLDAPATPETPATPTPAKRTRKLKVKSARSPRVVDPAVAEIKAEAKRRISAHRLSLKSDAILDKWSVQIQNMTRETLVRLLQIVDSKLFEMNNTTT